MARGDLSDAAWERLESLLPPPRQGVGRPPHDSRQIINGILWILRTGAPWRDLPERYGPWRTVASRFYRWRQAGLWDRLPAPGGRSGPTGLAGSLCGRDHCPRPSARRGGAGGKNPAAQALGRSRGGWSTKVHLRAEGHGKPFTLLLTPGESHEAPWFPRLMEQGAIARAGRGRPRRLPCRVVGDKGYSSQAIRRYARQRGIRVTIPHKSNEGRRGPFDRAIYRQRNLVERLINRFKQFRRLATRYEKLAANYQAMWVIVAILLWL